MVHPLIPSDQPPIFADGSYQLFLLDRKVQRLSPRTIDFYANQIPPFQRWCAAQGITTAAAVTATHIRSYLAGLHERGLAAASVHAAARSLRAYFNFCVREEMLSVSPMKKVSMPKLDRPVLPAFDAADADKLLRACADSRERAVVLCLLDTGCRASEFIALDGGDIDVAQGTVRIRKGKGGKERTVYLGNKSRKALLRYFLERGQPDADKAVWINVRFGTRLTDSGLRQLLERLGLRAGVAHCHPHTFRRTFALWSLRNGMSLYHLQRLMGHTDIAVLRQYLALVEADLQGAHAQYGAVDNMTR